MDYLHDHWKGLVSISLGVIVLVVLSFFFVHSQEEYDTYTVSKKSLINEVRVAGEVVPADEVSLGFAAQGKVSLLSVDDGDVVAKGQLLAELDTSELEATIRQASADTTLQQAELQALLGTGDSTGQLLIARQEALSKVEKAYSVADNQVKTRSDILYENPQSGRPQITYAITNFFTQRSLSDERVEIGDLLDSWGEYTQGLTIESVSERDIIIAQNNLSVVRQYFMSLATALSKAEPISGVSESTINEYRTTVSNAQTAVDASILELSTARQNLQRAISDVPVQEARVAVSKASLDTFRVRLSDSQIRAPFAGVVASVDVEVGEVVAQNQQLIELISNDGLYLEAYVPEVQLRDVTVGDIAQFTVDAYGEEVSIGAEVISIDVRATERQGVSTYKTRFSINETDITLRAGMTADIVIETSVIDELLLVPLSTVFEEAGMNYVYLLEDGERQQYPIQTGRRDSFGNVEITQGLEVGDKIILESL